MSEEIKEQSVPAKKPKDKEAILEIIVAIFLGITALATAWATWIGSLHGGNMSTNYTKSNNLAADGNTRWNEASQLLMQDMTIWNLISDYEVEILYAQDTGDTDKEKENAYKILFIANDNLSDSIAQKIGYSKEFDADAIINWVLNSNAATASPFDDDFIATYYDEAREVLNESEEVLKEGQEDNKKGDTFSLVSVFYSVVLFLLGIAGTFKRIPNRTIIIAVAIAGFLFATIFMFTIPLPTGFSFMSFFGA